VSQLISPGWICAPEATVDTHRAFTVTGIRLMPLMKLLTGS
jgi:hypothetical protein